MIEGQCAKNGFKITKYIPVKFIGDKRVSITFESVPGSWKINRSGYDYVSIVNNSIVSLAALVWYLVCHFGFHCFIKG